MAKRKTDSYEQRYRVKPGTKVSLARYDTDSKQGVPDKTRGRQILSELQSRLDELQEVLYAQAKHSVLVVLQAMDTGGKDSTVRHIFGPLNPQGVQVIGYKAPTAEELAHDFLWRVHHDAPPKGMIHIFNRSHYEDVLIARVHDLAPRRLIDKRYGHINDFERMLVDHGTTILKFYLHISKDEQKERLQSRLDRPDKHWKFNPGDLDERKLWRQYMRAYERMLERCSTASAPWYVIPSNRKWYRDVVIARIVLHALRGIDLEYPDPAPGLDDIVISD